MPRRSGQAPAAEPAAEVEEDVEMIAAEDADTYELRFNDPLNWRAGRPIPTGELLDRLQTLYAELRQLDQDDRNAEILTPKAQELANVQLLAHKDKGVKAWTLLCIVRMFYLLAPNAPYKASQLRDIFSIFSTQVIPTLADPENPYNEQYVEVLKSLAESRSVVLIQDIDAEALMLQIFQNAFDVVAGNGKDDTADKIPKNTEYQLSIILSDIVEDQPNLPMDVVEVILAQFLRADVSITGADVETSILSPAYEMARGICNNSIQNMTKHVSQWYSSVLVGASEAATARPRGKKRKHEEDDDEDMDNSTGPTLSAEDLKDAEKAHKLLRELWRSAPDVVQGVMPQIEAELSAENVNVRALATLAVGDLISGVGAAGLPGEGSLDPAAWPSQSLQPSQSLALRRCIAPLAFSKVYPDCYQAFMDRHRDKTSAVRSAWTTGAGRILATNAGGKGLDSNQETALLQHVKDCLMDHDEKVRSSTIDALASINYTTLVNLLSKDGGLSNPESILIVIAHRVKDPKASVRNAAIMLLAKLWGVASAAILQGDVALRNAVGGLPSSVLEGRYVNLADVTMQVLQALHDYLLPTSFPPIKSTTIVDSQQADGGTTLDPDAMRAERVLLLVSSLTERTERVFFGWQGQQARNAQYLGAFVDLCEINKPDEQAKQKLDHLMKQLTSSAVDQAAAVQHLKLYAKHNDKRNNQLIRFCVEAKSDYRKVYKAMQELRKRLEASTQLQNITTTILPLLKCSALLIYNRSHVPTYMRYASTDDSGFGAAANKLLKDIAASNSEVFKIHAAELCQSLQAAQPNESTPSDPTTVFSLKTCVGFARRYASGMPKDRAFYQAMSAYALYGSPPQAAKHAVSIIIAAATKKEMYITDILKQSITDFEYGQPHFLSRLAAIAQIQLLAFDQAAQEADEIATIAVQKVLNAVRSEPTDDDPEWPEADVEDSDLDAKLLAIKILVNGLRGRDTTDDSQDAEANLRTAANRVFRLLNTLIERDGQVSKAETPKHHKARLRLMAGVSILKLCSNRQLDRFLSHADFNRLARLCQDPVEQVRTGFAKSLRKYLAREKLPSRFLALTFLYAHEPAKKLKSSIETWVRARAAASTKDGKLDTVLENVFARLLSLLAHHPDFYQDDEDLKGTVVYIVFYLANVATEKNLPILYSIAQRLKTVQDGINVDKSEHLYLVSDLADATIRAFHEEKGWVFETTSDKARLPTGIFKALPGDVNVQELAEQRFLLEDMQDEIPALVKRCLKSRKKRSDKAAPIKKSKSTTDGTVIKADKTKRASHASRKRSSDSETPEPKPSKRSRASLTGDADDGIRRRSSRHGNAGNKSYAEADSDEEDEEMERWNNAEDDKENHDVLDDTPPTSEAIEEPEDAAQITPPQKAKGGGVSVAKAQNVRTGARTSARRSAKTSS